MVSTITPQDLYSLLTSEEEIAFLDVREHGIHAQGHPLFATPLPLSGLELDVERLLPRKSVQIVLQDQGDGERLAERASSKLLEFGYENIRILEGGVMGWHAAGLEIFSGVNVPSKAFGEVVEHECGTPHITAEELKSRLDAGEEIKIFDSRPYGEYHRMAIPGGVDMPGAELAYRIHEHVTDETTPIVVNCAGRTRSIIGAQSLINAGVKNPVMALKDGTMGWYLAGNKTERGAERVAAAPSAPAVAKSMEGVLKLAEQLALQWVDYDQYVKMRGENTKSIFLLDVRTEEEYLTSHPKGGAHAPGGQLVQATDEYVGVKNARIILYDDQKVRAIMTASWLKQMGWKDVYLLKPSVGNPASHGKESGFEAPIYHEVTAPELDAVLSSGQPVALIDLSTSLSYRKEHIPGASWAIRSRLENAIRFLPPVGMIILTADDERLAHLAAPELASYNPQLIVRVLQGGNSAWEEAGYRMEEGDGHMLSEAEDIWYKPYDNRDKIRERMQEYLDWETALIPQIKRDGTASYQVYTGNSK
ncbi:thiosulfate sulfurtransferase [Sneathiella sp. P13V-1]|uniref:rhodanese-like domain-containing protein n=1 Tax=Sneathiella sp. P13V-1 TaxID=2697366 RepID=UPI00187B6B7B|nr:rhodanese-like domain-containing protein [Sneathiella sp. P13V-1]MBE7635357.1 thiosulfate sulfurtransferase [Sneathiella sp. P13V-1]